MKPQEFYQSLLGSITDQDAKIVGGILLNHIGEQNAIALPLLAKQAFGEYNANTERKTRKILELLATEHRMPVWAYSGRSGRWLCADEEERQRVVADLEARIEALTARVKVLRTAIVPAQEPRFEREVQISFWR